MYESGRAVEVLRWLDTLPAGRGRRPDVALRRAYLHTLIGEPQQAAQVVHDLEISRLSSGQKVAVDALRTLWAFFDGTPESTISAADDALSALQEINLAELPDVFGMTSVCSFAARLPVASK